MVHYAACNGNSLILMADGLAYCSNLNAGLKFSIG